MAKITMATKTTIVLNSNNLHEVSSGGYFVHTDGHYISGNLNDLPQSEGGGKRWHYYRGNCRGSKPFVFATLELALDVLQKIGGYKYAKIFKGNYWIGEVKDGKFEKFDTPIIQLL